MGLIAADRIVGICRVVNDGDVIFANLSRLADYGMTKFIVSDMKSSDDTRAEIERFAGRAGVSVFVIDDPGKDILGSKFFTAMAGFAASALDATWILPFDADDFLWLAPEVQLDFANLEVDFILLPWLQMHPASFEGTTIVARLARPHLDEVTRLSVAPGKVLVRWQEDLVIERGHHWVHSKSGRILKGLRGEDIGLTMAHVPIRSRARFIGKIKGGAAAERLAGPAARGTHHSALGQTLEAAGAGFLDSLVDAMWRRDRAAFLALCASRALDPQQFGYLSDLVLRDSGGFLPPGGAATWQPADSAQRILAFRRKDRDTKHRIDVTTRLQVALLRLKGYARAS